MVAMAPLSKLIARSLTVLVERKLETGLTTVKSILNILEGLSANIEADWGSTALAAAREEDIGMVQHPVFFLVTL